MNRMHPCSQNKKTAKEVCSETLVIVKIGEKPSFARTNSALIIIIIYS